MQNRAESPKAPGRQRAQFIIRFMRCHCIDEISHLWGVWMRGNRKLRKATEQKKLHAGSIIQVTTAIFSKNTLRAGTHAYCVDSAWTVSAGMSGPFFEVLRVCIYLAIWLCSPRRFASLLCSGNSAPKQCGVFRKWLFCRQAQTLVPPRLRPPACLRHPSPRLRPRLHPLQRHQPRPLLQWWHAPPPVSRSPS